MLIALVMILFSIGILIVAFFLHNTKYDKMLVLNSLSTHIVALMAFFAAVDDTYDLLDISIAYVCISFITSIAVFNFFGSKRSGL